MTLEEILSKYFGCKHPFLKNPILVDQGIDWKHYRYISRNGDKAYAKLVELITILKSSCRTSSTQMRSWNSSTR